MKYLLDTHTLIWAFNGNKQLPENVINVIESPKSQIFVSIVSFWEIAIKRSLGKLDIESTTENLLQEVQNSPIKIINIKPEYIFLLEKLPFYHKDPFDRLLIGTAKVEKLKIIGIDEAFDKYEIKRVWK